MSNENEARKKEKKNKHQTTHVKMYHIDYSKIAAPARVIEAREF